MPKDFKNISELIDKGIKLFNDKNNKLEL